MVRVAMRSTLVCRNSWGFAFAQLGQEVVTTILMAASADEERRQANQHQAMAARIEVILKGNARAGFLNLGMGRQRDRRRLPKSRAIDFAKVQSCRHQSITGKLRSFDLSAEPESYAECQ